MKKLFLLSLHFFLTISLLAQIPAGYYDAANGKTNGELKTSLYQIIKVGKRLSYGSGSSSTWSGFEKSDLHPEGYVWDMYSNNKRYFPGNGGSVSGMNIEHSVAKSWWGGASNDAYKDLYHLNPSDATANSARSNYPLGTNNGSKFDNGSIKVGNNTFSTDYSGLCFEPLDEYKGDFARAYMYMFTCYEDYSWTSTNAPTMIVANETWPMLKTWAKNLLVTWSRQDPVSEKERTRLEKVYEIQRNRNPFIDYPELVEYIWGAKKGTPWSLTSGIDEFSIEFSVSPNPVQNELIINTEEQNITYTVFNLSGQVLTENQLNISKTISTEQLQNGMYLLQLSTGNKKTVQKFVVNK